MAVNIFNSVKGLHPKRNKFTADTYRNDFTAPLGADIPVFLMENIVPNTRVKCSASALVRLQALIAPVMDNIDFYVHFWKVTPRILENDRFTAFISGEIEPDDYDALFVTPFDLAEAVVDEINNAAFPPSLISTIYNTIFGNGSLLDFLGYDKKLFPTVKVVSAQLVLQSDGNAVTVLNWRSLIAYFMLHSNWYMNENVPYYANFLEDVNKLVEQQDLDSLAALLVHAATFDSSFKCAFLPHAWEKDYFTSALPNVQSGDPVSLSLTGSAPVTGSTLAGTYDLATPTMMAQIPEGYHAIGGHIYVDENGFISRPIADLNDEPSGTRIQYLQVTEDGLPVLGTADLSEASAITINELRFANALQVFKERQMRFGKRRQEYYKGFFDVEPEDFRLQVPKYLGGGRIPINIADIEQTSATSGSSALGHLAGKATAVAGGFAGFSTFCSEESIIIGIAFAMPHITYANTLSRMKMKTDDLYDYFNPCFEHLGEQAIKNVEVYTGSNNPDGDFGYTPRYTEYRFHMNEMHGEFKDSLSFWSLGRIFSSQPALNPSFIYMQPSVFSRIFAVSNQPNMVVSMLFHVRAIKPISKYGTPMLLA